MERSGRFRVYRVVESVPRLSHVSLEDADNARGERAVRPACELRMIAAARPGDAKEVLSQHGGDFAGPRQEAAAGGVAHRKTDTRRRSCQ